MVPQNIEQLTLDEYLAEFHPRTSATKKLEHLSSVPGESHA
jgi:hypothetical protein